MGNNALQGYKVVRVPDDHNRDQDYLCIGNVNADGNNYLALKSVHAPIKEEGNIFFVRPSEDANGKETFFDVVGDELAEVATAWERKI